MLPCLNCRTLSARECGVRVECRIVCACAALAILRMLDLWTEGLRWVAAVWLPARAKWRSLSMQRLSGVEDAMAIEHLSPQHNTAPGTPS